MLTLSIIVAVAQNGVIGFQDKLPWDLPADTAYFRQKIQGRPTLMGRKSYLAPDAEFSQKINVVLSRSLETPLPPNFVLKPSLPEALEWLEARGETEAFILGGQRIYAETLPLASFLYWTRVWATPPGDAFFPEVNWAEWDLKTSTHHPADERHHYAFDFEVYERKGSPRQP